MERIRQAVEQARRDREKSGLVSQARLAPSMAPDSRDAAVENEVGPGTQQIEYRQSKPVVVGALVRDRKRLVATIDGHPLQDSYRMLRTRILQEMKANGWNTIAVTSPAPGAGKTLTAVNLAIMIGRDPSYTALLIDADLRSPSVHRNFGYEPEFGINDFLFNDVPLSSVLFHPDMQGLTVLPGRDPIRESAEALASPKMVSMLSEVRSRYANRIIVLDIAPVLSVDDALAIKPNIDCLLMVVESGKTKRDEFAEAIELVDPLPVIGTVLNKSSKKLTASY